MRKYLIFALLFALVSCESLKEEFQPVFIGKYDNPDHQAPASMKANTTIAKLAAMYKIGNPMVIKKDIIVGGVVSTTDKPGNFYKSFYIQDETGGMEIKIGKNSLYNDFLPGQMIYVKCQDLCVGMYGYKSGDRYGYGMVQIGFSDPSGEYETSYIENTLLMDARIFKGEMVGEVTPIVLKDSDLPTKEQTQATNPNIGKLVTINDLTYGNGTDKTFVLLYLDSNKNKKDAKNRIFLTNDDGLNPNITTWAMSKEKMTEHLTSGLWDNFVVGSGNEKYEKVAEHRGDGSYPSIEKNAYAVSQYFTSPGGTCIQIRTSGFSKFADTEIDPEVLAGRKKLSVTGILTLYQGSIQITVNDITDLKVQ